MDFLKLFVNILKKHPELITAIIVALLEELKSDPALVLKALSLIKFDSK